MIYTLNGLMTQNKWRVLDYVVYTYYRYVQVAFSLCHYYNIQFWMGLIVLAHRGMMTKQNKFRNNNFLDESRNGAVGGGGGGCSELTPSLSPK